MTSPGLATLVVAAALLLPACSSDDNAASTSASAATTSTAAASTTSTTAVPLLTPDGLGALTLRMTKAAARATGRLGPEGPGCQPSSAVHAPLLAPLAGHAAFNSGGRLLGLSLEGATTATSVATPGPEFCE